MSKKSKTNSNVQTEQKTSETPATAKPDTKAKGKDRDKAVRGGKDKPATKTAKKESRVSAAVKAIQGLNGQPATVAEIVTKADAIYVKGGGPSNAKEALYGVRKTLDVMETLNLITVVDGKVSRK